MFRLCTPLDKVASAEIINGELLVGVVILKQQHENL